MNILSAAILVFSGLPFFLDKEHERKVNENINCHLYRPFIEKNLEIYKNPLFDVDLICEVIYQESRFNPLAVSQANAFGLMQIRLIVLKEMFSDTKYFTINLMNPFDNIRVGIWYLHKIKKYIPVHCKHSYEKRLHFILSAYNHGAGKAKNYKTCQTIYSNSIISRYKNKKK